MAYNPSRILSKVEVIFFFLLKKISRKKSVGAVTEREKGECMTSEWQACLLFGYKDKTTTSEKQKLCDDGWQKKHTKDIFSNVFHTIWISIIWYSLYGCRRAIAIQWDLDNWNSPLTLTKSVFSWISRCFTF